MKKFKIENGKIYSKTSLCEREDIFEIVEKIPKNFYVWNIGENMGSDEYIPICEDLHPDDKNNYEINTSTLKAIKLDTKDVEILRKSAGVGVNSVKTAEKALKSKRTGYNADRKRKASIESIDIFRRISA